MVDISVGYHGPSVNQYSHHLLGLLEWVLGKRSGHWMSFLTRNTLLNADRSLSTLHKVLPCLCVQFLSGSQHTS